MKTENMLTPNEEKYLHTIPEDKIAIIRPFDPRARKTAHEIIGQIKNALPDLDVFFGGAMALGIAGQNDIDINLLSTPQECEKSLPILKSLFGEPKKANPILIKWEFTRNGFEVELYLTDKNSPELQRQMQVQNLLEGNSGHLKEYERIKLQCNGLSFREYMRRKYEFFHTILNK